jgi:hypothetical protein
VLTIHEPVGPSAASQKRKKPQLLLNLKTQPTQLFKARISYNTREDKCLPELRRSKVAGN